MDDPLSSIPLWGRPPTGSEPSSSLFLGDIKMDPDAEPTTSLENVTQMNGSAAGSLNAGAAMPATTPQMPQYPAYSPLFMPQPHLFAPQQQMYMPQQMYMQPSYAYPGYPTMPYYWQMGTPMTQMPLFWNQAPLKQETPDDTLDKTKDSTADKSSGFRIESLLSIKEECSSPPPSPQRQMKDSFAMSQSLNFSAVMPPMHGVDPLNSIKNNPIFGYEDTLSQTQSSQATSRINMSTFPGFEEYLEAQVQPPQNWNTAKVQEPPAQVVQSTTLDKAPVPRSSFKEELLDDEFPALMSASCNAVYGESREVNRKQESAHGGDTSIGSRASTSHGGKEKNKEAEPQEQKSRFPTSRWDKESPKAELNTARSSISATSNQWKYTGWQTVPVKSKTTVSQSTISQSPLNDRCMSIISPMSAATKAAIAKTSAPVVVPKPPPPWGPRAPPMAAPGLVIPILAGPKTYVDIKKEVDEEAEMANEKQSGVWNEDDESGKEDHRPKKRPAISPIKMDKTKEEAERGKRRKGERSPPKKDSRHRRRSEPRFEWDDPAAVDRAREAKGIRFPIKLCAGPFTAGCDRAAIKKYFHKLDAACVSLPNPPPGPLEHVELVFVDKKKALQVLERREHRIEGITVQVWPPCDVHVHYGRLRCHIDELMDEIQSHFGPIFSINSPHPVYSIVQFARVDSAERAISKGSLFVYDCSVKFNFAKKNYSLNMFKDTWLGVCRRENMDCLMYSFKSEGPSNFLDKKQGVQDNVNEKREKEMEKRKAVSSDPIPEDCIALTMGPMPFKLLPVADRQLFEEASWVHRLPFASDTGEYRILVFEQKNKENARKLLTRGRICINDHYITISAPSDVQLDLPPHCNIQPQSIVQYFQSKFGPLIRPLKMNTVRKRVIGMIATFGSHEDAKRAVAQSPHFSRQPTIATFTLKNVSLAPFKDLIHNKPSNQMRYKEDLQITVHSSEEDDRKPAVRVTLKDEEDSEDEKRREWKKRILPKREFHSRRKIEDSPSSRSRNSSSSSSTSTSSSSSSSASSAASIKSKASQKASEGHTVSVYRSCNNWPDKRSMQRHFGSFGKVIRETMEGGRQIIEFSTAKEAEAAAKELIQVVNGVTVLVRRDQQ